MGSSFLANSSVPWGGIKTAAAETMRGLARRYGGHESVDCTDGLPPLCQRFFAAA